VSVVVLGMEMPADCWGCTMSSFGYCNIAGKIWELTKRPDWCPLRPLPEEHGDLIDRDAFLKAEWDWCDAEDAIKAMPVIIEAEGENDAL